MSRPHFSSSGDVRRQTDRYIDDLNSRHGLHIPTCQMAENVSGRPSSGLSTAATVNRELQRFLMTYGPVKLDTIITQFNVYAHSASGSTWQNKPDMRTIGTLPVTERDVKAQKQMEDVLLAMLRNVPKRETQPVAPTWQRQSPLTLSRASLSETSMTSTSSSTLGYPQLPDIPRDATTMSAMNSRKTLAGILDPRLKSSLGRSHSTSEVDCEMIDPEAPPSGQQTFAAYPNPEIEFISSRQKRGPDRIDHYATPPRHKMPRDHQYEQQPTMQDMYTSFTAPGALPVPPLSARVSSTSSSRTQSFKSLNSTPGNDQVEDSSPGTSFGDLSGHLESVLAHKPFAPEPTTPSATQAIEVTDDDEPTPTARMGPPASSLTQSSWISSSAEAGLLAPESDSHDKRSVVSEPRFGAVISPFHALSSIPSSELRLRDLYELTRIAQNVSVSPETLFRDSQGPFSDYRELCDAAMTTLRGLPEDAKATALGFERSPAAVWQRAQGVITDVCFSGKLLFDPDEPSRQPLVRLLPLKSDMNNRFTRTFGGDRFFVLNVPDMAEYGWLLARLGMPGGHSDFIRWLGNTDHSFLGRTWKACSLKEIKGAKKPKKNTREPDYNISALQVVLFAVDGVDFQCLNADIKQLGQDGLILDHSPLGLDLLLDWIIPFHENKEQKALKLFSRIGLAFSKTVPTVCFNDGSHIVRTYDAYSEGPYERNLSIDKRGTSRHSGRKGIIMNDGCGRISYRAAIETAQALGLTYLPSAFQGRIGGAKGVWIVEYSQVEQLSRKCSDPDRWIEVTDSQKKMDLKTGAQHGPDPCPQQVTLDVLDFSKPLKSHNLNKQLISVLNQRGVPAETFIELLDENLRAFTDECSAAVEIGGAVVTDLIQKYDNVSRSRIANGGVEMRGGQPESDAEQMNMMLEPSFDPKENSQLAQLCKRFFDRHCDSIAEAVHIEVPKSTFAIMIPDPTGVLQEGEVQLNFSPQFDKQCSELFPPHLTGHIVVARLPAYLPWDVQKVSAVYYPELSNYKDAIIFSVRGQTCLAEILSGGDYDGDKAWISWDQRLVGPFKNLTKTEISESDPEDFGLNADTQTVGAIMEQDDAHQHFMSKAFEFNMQPSVLGHVSNYHERYSYTYSNNEKAMRIGILAGYLVDAPKSGYIYTQTDFKQYLKKNGMPAPHELYTLAYENPTEKLKPTEHVLDIIAFKGRLPKVKEAKDQFEKQFITAHSYDPDISAMHENELEYARHHSIVAEAVLQALSAELKQLYDLWFWNCQNEIAQKDNMAGKWLPLKANHALQNPALSFKRLVEILRGRFLNLVPQLPEGRELDLLVERWLKDANHPTKTLSTGRSWRLLKASMLFALYHSKHSFVYYVAGREICELKARAVEARTGLGMRMVADTVHAAYKIDGSVIKARKARHEEVEGMAIVNAPGLPPSAPGVELGYTTDDEDYLDARSQVNE